jgi:hypothetical protein
MPPADGLWLPTLIVLSRAGPISRLDVTDFLVKQINGARVLYRTPALTDRSL